MISPDAAGIPRIISDLLKFPSKCSPNPKPPKLHSEVGVGGRVHSWAQRGPKEGHRTGGGEENRLRAQELRVGFAKL